jgi:carbon monoxide dehydrogenase subunit G
VNVTVERKRAFRAPAGRVVAALQDQANLQALMPRVERVDVLARGDRRARLALHMRLGRLGSMRVEGEARELDDGTRFISVQPMELDSRFQVTARGDESDVVARLSFQLPRQLEAVARWVPQRMIRERVARELDAALDALEDLVK